MEKSTIQHIQDTASFGAVIEQLKTVSPTMPVAFIPESIKMSSLEDYLPYRNRFQFAFKTGHIQEYLSYICTNDCKTGICLVDSDSPLRLESKCIFDLGDASKPLHQDHVAYLSLKATSPYRSLLNKNFNEMSQVEASEWIEDWSDYITVFDKLGQRMENQKAAQRIRDITIEQARQTSTRVDDFSESMSVCEQVEAKNQESIPSLIEFTCVPFLDFSTIKFNLRVSILTGSDKPKLAFRISQLEVTQDEIAHEFRQKVADELSSIGMPVYFANI